LEGERLRRRGKGYADKQDLNQEPGRFAGTWTLYILGALNGGGISFWPSSIISSFLPGNRPAGLLHF